MSEQKNLIIAPEHLKEPTATWAVLLEAKDGNVRIEVEAFNMFMDAGCLVFRKRDGKILTAIPAGTWKTVELKP